MDKTHTHTYTHTYTHTHTHTYIPVRLCHTSRLRQRNSPYRSIEIGETKYKKNNKYRTTAFPLFLFIFKTSFLYSFSFDIYIFYFQVKIHSRLTTTTIKRNNEKYCERKNIRKIYDLLLSFHFFFLL